MAEMKDVECEYCGNVIELSKAVRLNPETEEYEYACENCAIKMGIKKPGSTGPISGSKS